VRNVAESDSFDFWFSCLFNWNGGGWQVNVGQTEAKVLGSTELLLSFWFCLVFSSRILLRWLHCTALRALILFFLETQRWT
jgi:hypothetical protein